MSFKDIPPTPARRPDDPGQPAPAGLRDPGHRGHAATLTGQHQPRAYAACDSGGIYWVSKPFSEGIGINRACDRAYSSANAGFANRSVNGGGNGYMSVKLTRTSFLNI